MALQATTIFTMGQLISLLQQFRKELGEDVQRTLTTNERSVLTAAAVELLQTTDLLLHIGVMKDDQEPDWQ
jgi:hypothetical protein